VAKQTSVASHAALIVLFVLCPLNIPVQADHDDSSSGMGELCGWLGGGQMDKRHRSHAGGRRICSTGVRIVKF